MKHNLLNKLLSLTLLIMGGAFLNPAWGESYELYSGALTEGDYIIWYSNRAMTASVSNNRLGYTAVTPQNNSITTSNASIIWHIAPSGDYWTIYNAGENKYAASNGTKNQAQLLESGSDDKSLWSVTGTKTYEFVNKFNNSKSVNANLRNNTTNGFACYSTSTGGALSLYKKVDAAPAYTITATSNNVSYGTVSLTGSTITATPEDGYRVVAGDGGYTVTNGTATVVNNGDNTFTVTPSADCTVQINFEAIPTHTAHFSVNGTIDNNDDDTVAEGADITFPDDPDDINGKTFVGWVANAIVGTTDSEPSLVTSATMSTSDVTFYAVFATAAGSGSDSWTETDLASITASDIFVFSNGSYALNNDGESANPPSANSITVSGEIITSTVADNLKWNVSGNSTDGYTFYPNGTTETWLYCNTTAASSSNNNIRVGTGDRKLWVFDNDGYLVTNDNSTARYLSLYNSQDFRGYTSNSNAFVPKFYKFVAGTTYSAYCTTVSSLPVPTIVFKNSSSEEITSIDVTANDITAVNISCLDENDDPMDVEVTVTSSDDTVAEYDDGDIWAYKGGTVTLTATFAGNGSYQGTSATLTVNVAKASSTTVVEVTVDDTDVYTATEDGLAVATVKNASGTAIAGAAVTYTSSNTAVATIAADGTITLVGAGTTTITASYAGNDIYEASDDSYVLTLTSSEPQATTVNIALNNTFFGCEAFTSWTTGMATSLSGTKNNVTVTYDKGTGSMYCNADKIRYYTNNTFTITAPSGYHVVGVDMNVSIATASPSGTISSDTWTGDAASVSFTFDNKTDISSITITLAETVTIGSAGYTTYVAKHDISFPAEVTAFIATATSASTVTLTSKESVSEGTPVVVKGEAGTYALPTITTTPESVSGNLLLASDGSVEGNGSSIYALGLGKTGANEGKVGFYLVDENVVIPAGKAYLNLSGSLAKEFLTFDFSETPDGIKTLSQTPVKEEGIYNLSGQRLNKMQKGINIVNGKKVLY